jgi:UDP-N-acetylmuramate dehydrogenase
MKRYGESKEIRAEMEMEVFYQQLVEKGIQPLWKAEPLKKYTSWKIGGPADILYAPPDYRACVEVLKMARQAGVPVTFLGAGTNVLVADEGVRGLVILTTNWREVTWDEQGTKVTSGAGVPIAALSRLAGERGLTGLEYAVGIPGTLGGAVIMNAGAYGCALEQVLTSVKTLDEEGKLREYQKGEMALGYRTSIFQGKKELIVEATLALQPGKIDEIRAKMNEYLKLRREKQPLDLPSAGSIFKNTERGAGRLVEAAGAKGWRIGDAQVSKKHANFIVNLGEAKAADVLALIAEVQKAAQRQFNVELETEIVLLGFQDTGR